MFNKIGYGANVGYRKYLDPPPPPFICYLVFSATKATTVIWFQNISPE